MKRCTNCGDQIDTENWRLLAFGKDENDEFVFQEFCGPECKERWQADEEKGFRSR